MKFFLISVIMILAFINVSTAQNKYISFDYNPMTPHPLFSKVDVIDKRPNTRSLGFVQVGPFNQVENAEFKGSLKDSICNFFLARNDSQNNLNELAIILKEIALSEITRTVDEEGYLKLSMRLFSKDTMGSFFEILNIDTTYTVRAMDVTNKLIHSLSVHLCEISSLAAKADTDNNELKPHRFFTDLFYLDSLEKLNIPIYNTEKYKSGIFYDYQSFMSNSADGSTIKIDTSNLKRIKVYKIDNELKKEIQIDYKTVYAISDGNILVKATPFGFYKLDKINYDFYYSGLSSVSNSSDAIIAGLAFGALGAAAVLAAEKHKKLFRFKLDYLHGNSIIIAKAE